MSKDKNEGGSKEEETKEAKELKEMKWTKVDSLMVLSNPNMAPADKVASFDMVIMIKRKKRKKIKEVNT